jgi:hypothetical protein
MRMNHSREKVVRTGKLGAETSSGNTRSSARGYAAERPALSSQNSIPAAEHNISSLDAQRIESETLPGSDGYAALVADFRSHHEANAAQRRGPYEYYRLVYRYGYDLGTDPRFRSADWPTVEQAARPRWEERNPGTWDEFKETIQYAWDKARGRCRDDC